MSIRTASKSLLISLNLNEKAIIKYVHVAMYNFGCETEHMKITPGTSHIDVILFLSRHFHSKEHPRYGTRYMSVNPFSMQPINPTFIWMADPHNAYLMQELNRIAFELLNTAKQRNKLNLCP